MDVYRITGLPIVSEMYEEFSPLMKIMSKKLPYSLLLLLQSWDCLYKGKLQSKYTEWVEAFIDDHPDYPPKKAHFSSSLAKS